MPVPLGPVYIRGMNVYKNIRRESNLMPDFRFVDGGIAGSSGRRGKFSRRPQVSDDSWSYQVAAPLKIQSLAKNSCGVVGEVYERAASKCYGYSNSQGTAVCLCSLSAAPRHRIAFRVRQQEHRRCRATTADARHSG